MSERRLFTVSAPDWGQTHLTSDAVVAFVDDELAQRPQARAAAHVDACPDCAAEVVAQRQARTALRGASCPSLPSSLLMSLRSIPQDTELPAAPAGLAVTAEGQLVSVLRNEAAKAAPAPAAPTAVDYGRRPPASRRKRFGTGAAVSGLAIGALALGVATLPASFPAPSADRGVLGGSLLNPSGALPARLGLEAQTSPADDARLGGLGRLPRAFVRHGVR